MSLLDALLRGATDSEKETFRPTSPPSPPSSPPDPSRGEAGGEGGDVRGKVFISAKMPPAQDRTRHHQMRALLGKLADPPGLAEWLNGERPDLLAHGWAMREPPLPRVSPNTQWAKISQASRSTRRRPL